MGNSGARVVVVSGSAGTVVVATTSVALGNASDEGTPEGSFDEQDIRSDPAQAQTM
jgi:hypothetical protein